MRQLGKLMLIALGFGVLAAALSTIPSSPVSGATGPDPVIVTNTPLGVSGTVNVGNSPTVNLGVGNTVSITGNNSGAPVFVRDTDNPAKQPFTASCFVTFSSGFSFCNVATVPTGKELVVEMFASQIIVSSGTRPFEALLLGTANGTNYQLEYPLSFNGSDNGIVISDYWTVQQPLTRAYADPNTTVLCKAHAVQGTNFNCNISGYLVDVP